MDYFPNKYAISISSMPSIVLGGGTPKRLYGPAQPGTGAATIYTVPASTRTTVDFIRIVNTTASDATITISIGADAAATRIFSAFNVIAHGLYAEFVDFTLTAAEVIQAFQGTSGALTVTINGNEIAV